MIRHTATRAPRFDREWKDLINLLPESRRMIMERAIRDYQLTGIEPRGLDGAEMMAFMLIKKTVDRRAKQRNARILRRNRLKSDSKCTQQQPDSQKPDMEACQPTTEKSISRSKPDKPLDNKHPRQKPYFKVRNQQPAMSAKQRLIVKRLNRLSPKPRKR